MSLLKKRQNYKATADAHLVLAATGGDRNAFGEIVSRYQNLLCSLAYASVGDLKHSEDIAQETFVEAWRKLESLSDPEKLKAWLCGILRFKISRYRRRENRHKGADEAEPDEQAAGQKGLDETLIHEQEQTLLWQALEQLPENYREPLILFYREHNSVEQVAAELDLSEDAVKQRLSRGRKSLHRAMVRFVEDGLAKSKPGAAFTTSVLLAISTVSAPKAKAALLVGAGKTGALFKWAGLLTLISSLSGVIGALFSLRASLDQSRTATEKYTAIAMVSIFFLFALIYTAGMFLFKHLALGNFQHAGYYTLASQMLVLAFTVAYLLLLRYMLKVLPMMRATERLRFPEAFAQLNSRQREFKTRLSLLGVPLVHFKLGAPEMDERPAFAWLAGGDRAYGLVFAWGGLAVAPVSVGIVSVGLVTVGALGIGLLSAGTVAFGLLGFGASAIAYKAYASLSALGWQSAVSGGFSIAREAAIGPVAFARHINTDEAAGLAHLTSLNQSYLWVLAAISLLVMAPALWHSQMVRLRMKG